MQDATKERVLTGRPFAQPHAKAEIAQKGWVASREIVFVTEGSAKTSKRSVLRLAPKTTIVGLVVAQAMGMASATKVNAKTEIHFVLHLVHKTLIAKLADVRGRQPVHKASVSPKTLNVTLRYNS